MILGLDGTVKMWEFKTGMIVKTFKGHPNQKYSTCFGFIKLGSKTGFVYMFILEFMLVARMEMCIFMIWRVGR
jgi:hypothetical protein